jgi:hypothetical protein
MTPLKHSSDCRILAMDESDWNKASDTDSSYPSIQRAVFFSQQERKTRPAPLIPRIFREARIVFDLKTTNT